MEEFQLKSISPGAVPEALAKAEHYRLLNQPEEAESICRDVLHLEPQNQQALVVLTLALTDQIGHSSSSGAFKEACDHAAALEDAYQRSYYGGIARERRARAFLRSGMARGFAYDVFRNAMECFEQALALRPSDDDNAILRWNSCVRAIQKNKLEPRPDDGELPME